MIKSKEKRNAVWRAWYARNKERIGNKRKVANLGPERLEHVRALARKYYYKNRAPKKDWLGEEYLKKRQSEHKRRLREEPDYAWRQYEQTLLWKYGMSRSDFEWLFDAQSGKCAGCLRPIVKERLGTGKSVCVDHCHLSGQVRGLLCAGCNVAVGAAGDDYQVLERLSRYVKACESLGDTHRHRKPLTMRGLVGFIPNETLTQQ